MGSPAGAGGSGATGKTASVYTPKLQGTADDNFWKMLDPMINSSAEGGAGTPAALAYGQALPFTDRLAQGWSNLPEGATGGGYMTDMLSNDTNIQRYATDTLFPMATGNASSLSAAGIDALNRAPGLYDQGKAAFDAAPQILDLGLDPRNAQYGQQRGQSLDAASVANSMAGLGSSPYGASVTGRTLNDFDSGWQDDKLKRAEDAATSYGGLLKTGGALTTEGGLMTGYGGQALTSAEALGGKAISDTLGANRAPFSDLTGGVNTITSDLSRVSDLGTAKYALPQQTINDLESYMGIGQSASKLSGQLGAMGQEQLGSSLSGFGNLAGTGSNLLFGSSGSGLLGSGGIGGLLGGGGAAAETAATGGLWDTAASLAPLALS